MIEALILGIVQGLTEFLPVSSSGYLVLAQLILPRFETPGALFEVVLHGGSLLAAVLYFKNDLMWIFKGLIGKISIQENANARSWITGIFIATIPVGIVALLAKSRIEALFDYPLVASIALLFTGAILFMGEWFQSKQKQENSNSDSIGLVSALKVGIAQAVALIPGVSRSGMTMAAGLSTGWSRVKAARFSFLLMLPAVAGAVVLESRDVYRAVQHGDIDISALFAGFIASFIASYLAIRLLMNIIRKYSFKPFAVYCLTVGTLSIVLQLILC